MSPDDYKRMRGGGQSTPAQNADRPQTPLPQIVRDNPLWTDFYAPLPGLPAVTEKSVLRISAAYACVNLIAGAISALPINLYRETPDGERDQVFNDDLRWVLNEEFLPRWNAATGWEYLTSSLLFHGDAFAPIVRKGSKIVGIEPVHPQKVDVLLSPDRTRLIYAVWRENGQYDVFDQDDMLHVPGFGFDGYRGVSPLRHVLAIPGGVALATQEYAGRFFTNSARPDVVLSSDQVIDQEAAEQIKARWVQLYSGYANAHQPAVLGQGFKAIPLTMTAEDAQLLATRQFQIEEIARIYGVPPFMIGHTEKTTSWGSGVESMGAGFVRFTLRQHLHKFQTEINRKFFRTAGKVAEFDTFELEKSDMKTLFESFRIGVGRAGEPGFMTPEEVRRKLNLKRTPTDGTLSTGQQTTGQANAPQQAA
ncbi:phage portal protein [Novosphingobium olei]|uniref:phage portal protein n=1 Tax=Novosphingobium olei TaxID=2728851 RepID=UPI00308FE2E4|nr:phage portal protein [Novosphingobium olei]